MAKVHLHIINIEARAVSADAGNHFQIIERRNEECIVNKFAVVEIFENICRKMIYIDIGINGPHCDTATYFEKKDEGKRLSGEAIGFKKLHPEDEPEKNKGINNTEQRFH